MFVVTFVLLGLTSCTSASGKKQSVKEYSNSTVLPSLVRIKVLENHTISYVELTTTQQMVYRPLDTVWVNLSTHAIDDTSNYTMAAVLYSNPIGQ